MMFLETVRQLKRAFLDHESAAKSLIETAKKCDGVCETQAISTWPRFRKLPQPMTRHG